jgi:hypothetical protein
VKKNYSLLVKGVLHRNHRLADNTGNMNFTARRSVNLPPAKADGIAWGMLKQKINMRGYKIHIEWSGQEA